MTPEPDEEYYRDVRTLMSVLLDMDDPVLYSLRQTYENNYWRGTWGVQQEDIDKVLDDIQGSWIWKDITDKYLEHFTRDEIVELADFYSKDPGKKFWDLTRTLPEEIGFMIEDWIGTLELSIEKRAEYNRDVREGKVEPLD